jgi:hypothetical protein
MTAGHEPSITPLNSSCQAKKQPGTSKLNPIENQQHTCLNYRKQKAVYAFQFQNLLFDGFEQRRPGVQIVRRGN